MKAFLIYFLIFGSLLAQTEQKELPLDKELSRAADRHPFPIGIDLSHHSGEINWKNVKVEGVSFVFLKATEGDDFVDPKFQEYFDAAKSIGIQRGAYHFYESGDDPETMAEFFIRTALLEPGDLAPVVDIEVLRKPEDAVGLSDRLKRFLKKLETHFGVKPIIYTGPNFWNAHLSADFGEYPLWIAEFGKPEPQLPKGWTKWLFWQAVENQRIAGVEKDVDINYFQGKREGLAQYSIPQKPEIKANSSTSEPVKNQ